MDNTETVTFLARLGVEADPADITPRVRAVAGGIAAGLAEATRPDMGQTRELFKALTEAGIDFRDDLILERCSVLSFERRREIRRANRPRFAPPIVDEEAPAPDDADAAPIDPESGVAVGSDGQ